MSKNFFIDLHIYPFNVMFSIGETDAELKEQLDGIAECLTIPTLLQDLSLEKSGGMCYCLPKGSTIIRLKANDGSAKWMSTLTHEIFHAVYYTMAFIGCKLGEKSEEAYAYLIGYITEQFWNELNLS